MNVKLPLISKCIFIYFCYNTLHIIAPNLTGERVRGRAKKKKWKPDKDRKK